MIWSTEKKEATKPNVNINNEEVELDCMFDLTLNTKAPFSDIILESISDKMRTGFYEVTSAESGKKEFEKLVSTFEYVRKNYPNIRFLAVDGESFSFKASCLDCDENPDELEIELYIDTESSLYRLIEEHVGGKIRMSLKIESSEEIPDTSKTVQSLI